MGVLIEHRVGPVIDLLGDTVTACDARTQHTGQAIPSRAPRVLNGAGEQGHVVLTGMARILDAADKQRQTIGKVNGHCSSIQIGGWYAIGYSALYLRTNTKRNNQLTELLTYLGA